ncbi:hypothetical protein SXAG_00152 [Synechococcus phage S-CBS4]|nr:hypothetical protein SXAG_00152 [Synechococcus phage S-CBS4]
MDLNNLKPTRAEEGAVMEVLHPDTEEVIEGMTVTLLGQDSSVFKNLKRRKQNAMLTRMSKGKKAVSMDADTLERDALDEVVALTVDWKGFELDGKKLPFNDENARMVYSEYEWLMQQAQEFVANRSNFF